MITNTLTIAGTDCTGGAGIQADIKAISANGSYAMSVITAVVAQNTQGVQKIETMPLDLIRAQIDSVFTDVKVDAIKIGMLGTADIITCVAEALAKYKPSKVVLDPVMVAKSGDRLLDKDAIAALRDVLIPQVGLITPNLPEAADLLGVAEATSREQMVSQAKHLGVAALLKGGHLGLDESPDLLRVGDAYHWFEGKRIPTKNSHGTGCTLSAAIATFWGQGDSLDVACEKAKAYLTGALSKADTLNVGKGQGPVHHFYKYY
ncbi:bifunctional hydroxymethylpyrimidine kinase/phosphomethylpyrimidine kinase [Psychrobacter sp. FDAARGOS_221]|uniref:bifunctional hydroxymethylpyrimidine kinase/phosphomethylpyrimidine kinase n=1 Tax=Psychrobacter sp. FDAARGOS_221 TaxID=1975705 RepID=UPI000BB551C6|nr:bifunctional hydroxymethylpyrimidine kinase/phosphomethylpyrimidine kinase [Psychrobacter sp. FDAARGOS_221]PNK61595.1 bifunctional hydroxymethylpyrimidine kinase/phosphomethylpyrimidine kinase [Psychrobacter sp. FDAARGOS_221]